MVALVLVRDALDRHDRSVAVAERVHRRRAHAARGGPARHHHRVHPVPGQEARKRGLEERARHPLGVDRVHVGQDRQPVVEGVALRPDLDVLKAVLCVRPRAPHTGIASVLHVGDVRPDDRHPPLARHLRQAVDVRDLFGIGHVGRLEEVGPRVGLLRIDVHDSELLPEAEARAGGVRAHLLEEFAGRLVRAGHGRFGHGASSSKKVIPACSGLTTVKARPVP